MRGHTHRSSLRTQHPSYLMTQPRTLGLFQAISVGVGAIVGGGILALAGVAFATTGPSTLLVFILNGIIAMLTIVA